MRENGINREVQKENNVKQILKRLYRQDNCSRTSLAADMQLTQAAMTKLVNPLIVSGLIEERAPIETAVGRWPRRLVLRAEAYMILAGRINRDYVSAGLYDLRGRLITNNIRVVEAKSSPRYALALLTSMFSELKDQAKSPLLGIGLALPGPLNTASGKVTLMSGFPGWNQINLKEELEQEFSLPVFLEQDANCGALAELWRGDNQGYNNMIYITGDRGVGAGIVINGEIYHGNVGYAGEFGHMSINISGPRCECGNRGCLELYGSTNALESEYQKALFSELSMNDGAEMLLAKAPQICEKVRAGEKLASKVYTSVVRFLAFGTVGLINILNPERIIFADKITEGGELFIQIVNDTLKEYLMPELYEKLVVEISSLQGDPIMSGAGILVFDRMLEERCNVFLSE